MVRFNQTRAWFWAMLLVVVGASLFSIQESVADPSEPAGFVLMASGEVVAVQADKQLRPLKRKSPFYSGELLRTAEESKAQFRFRDGSLISLHPNSEIRLDEFHFNEPQKGKDKNIFTLIRGGFRTITGKIGKGDPDAYQMKSSVASIGVRGTTYEAVLHGALDVAAWQGTVIVSNKHGSLLVGVEGLFNFATVSSSYDAPQGLMRPPATLRESPEITPEEMNRVTSDEESVAAILNSSTQESAATAILDSGDEVGPLEDLLKYIVANNGSEAQQSVIDQTLATATSPTPVAPVIDNRVSGVTLDRLAMAVGGGTSFNGMLAGGVAGYNSSSILYIADNGLDPSQLGFNTTPYINVLSQGLAVSAIIPSGSVIDANHTVEWGGWQATALQPAYLMTDATNASIYTAVTQPVYWITATASANTAIAARTGLAQYRNTVGYAGASNTGPINQMYMNLSVNFDTAAAIGEVHIYNPGQYWEVNLSGNISAPVLNFTAVSGTLNGSGAVVGEFSSFFTGNNAQAIVSSFDLSLSGDPLTYVEGVVLVNDQAGDLRLTAAESASIDRVGMFAKSNGLSGSGVKRGRASDGAGGSPLFALNQALPGDPFFNSGINIELLRRNGVPLLQGVNTHGTYPVSWGIWDAGSLLQLSDVDPNISQTLVVSDPLVWMTVVPTLDTVIAARGGQGFYRFNQCCTPGYFGLVNGGGQINSTDFDLAVDFDRATFSGGLYVSEVDNDYWTLQFTGDVLGSQLAVTAPFVSGIYYNFGSSTNYTPSGDIAMTLTGPNGEAVAVLYDLEASGAPGFYIQGAFVAEPDLRLTPAEMGSMSHMALTSGSPIGSWWHMSTAADGANTPVFAGDTAYDPNNGAFYLASNGTVWRKGNAAETKFNYTVMGDPAYAVNWGRWDAGIGTEIVAQTDPTNPATQTLYTTGTTHWIVFNPTPATALAAKTGAVNYNVPVANAVVAGTDGAIDVGSFSFDATVDFDTGALNSGLVAFTHNVGAQSWSMNFSAPPGSLGSNGAFPIISASGTYNASPSATGSISLMTTGPNAEALAGSLSFVSGLNSVDGAFLVCQSGGC